MLTSRSNRPNIAITIGDPSGVGPEVVLKALASSKVKGLANFFVIGDGYVIDALKRDLGLRLRYPILDLSNVSPVTYRYGKSRSCFGMASIEYIDRALELLKERKADALVTAPVNKASIRSAGVKGFEGHTEYLALKTRVKAFAMMFVGRNLKIVLATRHIALKRVPERLSRESVFDAIMLTHKYLKRYFGIRKPRIGVAGLNPHAGENGLFGDEEARVVTPAVKKSSRRFGGITGPVPADVVFHDCLNKRYDAVVSLYHDQGLIPFKLLYFKDGVNLTLGLPFIRTSPDHGTAFDIAGKGVADPSSMIEAIRLACRLTE